eukprot:c55840_g1_i1 orf=210-371(+)
MLQKRVCRLQQTSTQTRKRSQVFGFMDTAEARNTRLDLSSQKEMYLALSHCII